METNNFEAAVAANEKAQKHAQEIQQTRVGGLGGSDAALVLKIGERGMSALTATDNKRLAVMMKLAEPDNWGGNAYTNAGHAFEEYAEKALPLNANYKREEYLERKLARTFKTFAHADFTERNMEGELERLTVCECKYVQDTTANTIAKYYAQLQWYYMLGADAVVLYHGTGQIEPFCVETGELVQIERDERTIELLLAGIKTLDEAIEGGWKPENVDKIALSETPELIRRAFEKLREIKAKESELVTQKAETVEILKSYLEDWGFAGIVTTENGKKQQVIYSRASVSTTFDAAKFLAAHPEFDKAEYYKQTKRPASISFK